MDDWNQRLIQLDEVDSTNRYALDLVRRNRTTQGLVVSAKFQSEGRGQRGKHWVAEPDENALFSIIYYPEAGVEKQFEYNQRVAVGLWMGIKSLMPAEEVTIKWPNDIYVGKRKIAGILIQNVLIGKRIDHMVTGIGVNVNQTTFSSTLPNPVSLVMLIGERNDPVDIIKILVDNVDKAFWEMQPHVVKAYYLQNLYLKSEKAYFRANGQRFLGEIVGISNQGELMVRDDTGIRCYAFGEIEYEQS